MPRPAHLLAMRKLAGASRRIHVHLAAANEVAVSSNPSASLIWSPMILLKGVVTNAEQFSRLENS